tara:strand:- start:136 stop:531 length:396 start_codon:yes stop_codon:yes gene_type:complete
MSIFSKEYLKIILIGIFFIFLLQAPIVESIEFDMTAARNAVGKRFASKFCEAKGNGFSSEASSEFALNNTYLKFVSFPDDKKFMENIWEFTIKIIRKDCGNYVTKNDEAYLREFLQEEGDIASNRELYLPH